MLVSIEITKEKTINKADIRPGDSVVLVHDASVGNLVHLAKNLQDSCSVEKVYDWCRAEDWTAYEQEVMNALALDFVSQELCLELEDGQRIPLRQNPFTAIFLGDAEKLPEIREEHRGAYLIREVKKETEEETAAKNFSAANQTGPRQCALYEAENLLRVYSLSEDAIRQNIRGIMRGKSFYDMDLSWDQIFGRKASFDARRELRIRLSDYESSGMKAINQTERTLRSKLNEIMDAYLDDPEMGPTFIRSFMERYYLPLMKDAYGKLEEDLASRQAIGEALEGEIQQTSARAAKASWLTGDREDRTAEYVDAMEGYQMHWLCNYQIQAECKVLQNIPALYDIMRRKLVTAEDGVQVSVPNDESVQVHVPDYTFESLTYNRLRFSPDFEARLKSPVQIRQKDLEEIGSFIRDRILRETDTGVYRIQMFEENPEVPMNLSPAEELQVLDQLSREPAVVRTTTFTCGNGLDGLRLFLRGHADVLELCRAEQRKLEKRHAEFNKILKALEA